MLQSHHRIESDTKPKDFFTQGLWGGLPQRTSFTPLMEYLKDALDTGQIEDRFSNSKSIKGYRSSYPLPDPDQDESCYNLLTLWDPGEKPSQPPLFRKKSTSELSAKMKVSDRIFTTKLGLSQSLMVQEGTHSLNVTLKGYSKKFWACLVRKPTKPNKSLLQPPKGGLCLTLTSHGQTYSPKCKPKWSPNGTLSFSWDGSAHGTHNRAKFPD